MTWKYHKVTKDGSDIELISPHQPPNSRLSIATHNHTQTRDWHWAPYTWTPGVLSIYLSVCLSIPAINFIQKIKLLIWHFKHTLPPQIRIFMSKFFPQSKGKIKFLLGKRNQTLTMRKWTWKQPMFGEHLCLLLNESNLHLCFILTMPLLVYLQG